MGSTITLPTSLRSRLERAFAAPLDDLRVETGPAARRVVEGAGGRFGCAVEGRVFLADPPPSLRFAVLAHEVAHAMQQRHRRRRTPDPVPLIEAEAQAAAASLLAGRRHPIRCAADPREPAHWGEAGHYYTVYFVALAGGAPKMDAYRIAFWAQAPDEVNDFDAYESGVLIMKSGAKRGAAIGGASSVPIIGPFLGPVVERRTRDTLEQQAWWGIGAARAALPHRPLRRAGAGDPQGRLHPLRSAGGQPAD